MSLEKQEAELNVAKLKVAKLELEYKIEKERANIKRLEANLTIQSEAILKAEEKLQGLRE